MFQTELSHVKSNYMKKHHNTLHKFMPPRSGYGDETEEKIYEDLETAIDQESCGWATPYHRGLSHQNWGGVGIGVGLV